jgi:hypothetical protein
MQLSSARLAVVDGGKKESIAVKSRMCHRVITLTPYMGVGE